mgnify:FL=1
MKPKGGRTMDDEAIIELFFSRSEQAIHELDLKYGQFCRKLSYNIVGDRRDAEECVNDAYLGAWNTIPPERPNPLLSYLAKLVRNLSLKLYHKNTAAKRSGYTVALDELGAVLSDRSTDDELSARELARHLCDFLDSMDAENRVIFMRRYWFSDSYHDIAALVGTTEKNVSVRLFRIREKLKRYLIERGVFV